LGPVWWVTSTRPSISAALALTSSTDLTTRTPPLASGPRPSNLPLPRPPAWIWRLHDEDRAAELFGGLDGLIDGEGGEAARNRGAELGEYGFGLMFVDVHEARRRLATGSPGRRVTGL
jgi:hypothetical protein